MLESNIFDTALILEGGGMRASYTAGVLNVLLRNNIFFDYVAGISAGATQASNYLSRDSIRTRRSSTDIMYDPHTAGWRNVLKGRGYIDGEYVFEHTSEPDEFLPFDFDTFDANPAQLRVETFNATTGTTNFFGREDLTSRDRFLAILRASASMPILMKPTIIDGDVHFDGGVGTTGGIPLDVAIADGYTKFFIVTTRPRSYVKKDSVPPRWYRKLLKDYPSVAEALITRPERYNETKRTIIELERQGAAYVFWAQNMSVSNTERNVAKLNRNYQLGLAQAQRELPAFKEFLNLA
ncbi:MAG: patatin family protein [Actinomycetaceae bacterium]|nr:patatin family protein [Actinomycetaceae bacterium]MDY6083478.1 patatin family protein [Actinomycetaceae bacterium]